MLARISRPRRVLGGFVAVLVCAVLAAPVHGQLQLGTRENTEIPFNKFRDQFNKLLSGEPAPDPVKDKALLEAAGQYLVWRVTWKTIESERWDVGMGKIQADLEKLMNEPATKEGKNKEFMKLLARQLIDRLKEVLALKYDTSTMAVTNAALMLPVLARCKQGEVSDFLLELTKTDKGNPVVHPFIRMCAIKGLGELSGPGGPPVDAGADAKALAEKGRRELARLEAIVQFIDSPYPPQGKGQEYDDALAFARREGVKALAQIQVPAYEINKGTVKGPVAFQLLRIASGEPVKVGPPFTLSEKLEAAIGLCQLKPGHNVELAAFVVANDLVEFATAYAEDYAYFSGKVAKDEPKRLPLLPWKLYALRFDAGLNALQNSLPKDSPTAKKVSTLRTDVQKMLVDISQYRQIDTPPLLQQDAAALQPATGEVYPGSKDFTLPLAK